MRAADAIRSGHTFERDFIFELEDERLETLLRERQLPLRPDDRERDPWWGIERRVPDGSLCLALREEALYWDVPETEEESWRYCDAARDRFGLLARPDELLRQMWLVRYDAEPFRLTLLDATPLRELTDPIVEEIRAGLPFDPAAYQVDLNIEQAKPELASGNYSGIVDLCSCGHWGDGSTFLWLVRHHCVAIVRVVDCAIVALDILPRRAGA